MTEPARSLDRKVPAPSSRRLYELSLKNFRCFAHKKLEIVQPCTLIIGSNGAGKTSLLEALYYTSYAHSFRTRSSRQMIKEGQEAFNLQLKISDAGLPPEEISIGFGPRKKLIKINGQNTQAHSEISRLFNCVSLTQEDIGIVTDGPERRRTFLNQNHYICDPKGWPELARRYKKILEQRNALLNQGATNEESFKIWTEQHWQLTRQIQAWRSGFIEQLNVANNELIKEYLPEIKAQTSIKYKPAQDCTKANFDDFYKEAGSSLFAKERIMKRTMFGAHLDDFVTTIYGMCARSFASRGEQKLLTLLIKCAAIKVVELSTGTKIGCMLIDDFLTDLDKNRVEKCQKIINDFGLQTIITMPILRRDLFPESPTTQEIFFN